MESENKNKNEVQNNGLSLPVAIAFTGIIIAMAILYNKVEVKVGDDERDVQVKVVEQNKESIDNVRSVSVARDHIRGNPEADVFIIEYSDTECPFCKQFHFTLKQVMMNYQNTGKVAWVYRHFPIEQLHSKARIEAIALECANQIGGSDKFWQYTDRLYEVTPANNGLDVAELPKIAEYVGLNADKFNSCLKSDVHNVRINEDLQNAVETGGKGTPWSIIVSKNGKKYPLSGAMPYENVKQIIDSLIENN